MELYWYIIIFLFGTIIGSFLNVVIYRLHTGKSLNGHSHCLSCEKKLSWYELIPLVSYLFLRARCKACSSWIPVRYFFVELMTGLFFLLFWHLFRDNYMLLILHLLLISVLIVIAVYDVRHTIIPDECTMLVCVLAVLFFAYNIFIEGVMASVLFGDIIAGVGAAFFFWALWYVSKGKWIGLGDAKLAFPLGVIVGLEDSFSMVVLSFWVGALFSLLVLFVERIPQIYKSVHCILTKKGCATHALEKNHKYLTMKSEIPFAPFLIVGFLLVELFHADIFTITLWLVPIY